MACLIVVLPVIPSFEIISHTLTMFTDQSSVTPAGTISTDGTIEPQTEHFSAQTYFYTDDGISTNKYLLQTKQTSEQIKESAHLNRDTVTNM